VKDDVIGTILSLCLIHPKDRWYLWLVVLPCFLLGTVIVNVYLLIIKLQGKPWQADPFFKSWFKKEGDKEKT